MEFKRKNTNKPFMLFALIALLILVDLEILRK